MGTVCDLDGRVLGQRGLYVLDGALMPGNTAACNPSMTIAAVVERALDDIVAQEQRRMVVGSVVFGSVLLVAVVFSAASLYALMAVAVARRTREIGIRIALGATPRRVLRTVFARAGRQLGGGILAGNTLILLLAWRADSVTADLLASSAITSVIMAAVGVLACAAPARRALRVQPTEALRQS